MGIVVGLRDVSAAAVADAVVVGGGCVGAFVVGGGSGVLVDFDID